MIIASQFLKSYGALRELAAQSIGAGLPPLWDAASYAGRPLLANPDAGLLYPGSVLFYVLPPSWAWGAFLLIHLSVLASGVRRVCQTLGFDFFQSLVAVFVCVFSAGALGNTQDPQWMAGFAWLPWLLLRNSISLRVALLALVLLSGSANALVAALVLVLCSLGSKKEWKIRAWVLLGAAMVSWPAISLYSQWLSLSSPVFPAQSGVQFLLGLLQNKQTVLVSVLTPAPTLLLLMLSLVSPGKTLALIRPLLLGALVLFLIELFAQVPAWDAAFPGMAAVMLLTLAIAFLSAQLAGAGRGVHFGARRALPWLGTLLLLVGMFIAEQAWGLILFRALLLLGLLFIFYGGAGRGRVLVIVAVLVFDFLITAASTISLSDFEKISPPNPSTLRARVLGKSYVDKVRLRQAGMESYAAGSWAGKGMRYAFGVGSRANSLTADLLRYADTFGRPMPGGLLSLFAVSHYVVGDKEQGARLERYLKPVPAALVGRVRSFDGSLSSWKGSGEEKSLFDRELLLTPSNQDTKLNFTPDGNWTVLQYQRVNSLVRSIDLPQNHRGGWVFVSESAYPGWSAALDGKTVSGVPAEVAFQAFKVEPGSRELVLHFTLPRLNGLLLFACFALLGLILLEIRPFLSFTH